MSQTYFWFFEKERRLKLVFPSKVIGVKMNLEDTKLCLTVTPNFNDELLQQWRYGGTLVCCSDGRYFFLRSQSLISLVYRFVVEWVKINIREFTAIIIRGISCNAQPRTDTYSYIWSIVVKSTPPPPPPTKHKHSTGFHSYFIRCKVTRKRTGPFFLLKRSISEKYFF
jgi:hypothetical protein